jgi:hypothetical protein
MWKGHLEFPNQRQRYVPYFILQGNELKHTFVYAALKVYKELERILKQTNINMSADKVIHMAKTITTIQIRMPLNNKILSKTMLIKRHKRIEILFDENFWGTH